MRDQQTEIGIEYLLHLYHARQWAGLLTNEAHSLTWWWELGRRGCNIAVSTRPSCVRAGGVVGSPRAHRGTAVFTKSSRQLCSVSQPGTRPAAGWGPGHCLHRVYKSKKLWAPLLLRVGEGQNIHIQSFLFLLNLPWFISFVNLLLSSFAYKMQMHSVLPVNTLR